MGVFDDVGGFIEDAADVVVDVAEGAVGVAVDALEAAGGLVVDAFGKVVDAAVDAAGAALESAADLVGVAADVAEATGLADIGDVMLTVMDDVVFDTVDFVTVGLVDVDYDAGVFGASVGIDDVFGASLTISDEGFEAGYDVVVASVDVSYMGDTFSYGAAAGVDWGPLPYVEGHVSLDEDGNVSVGGEVQAYLPAPTGLVGVEVEGDYEETDEGFRASGSATGGQYLYSGTYTKGGVHSSYEEDDDGYRFQVGAHGEVGQVGVGSIKGSVDYVEGREGDVSYEGVQAGATAEGFGASVEVEGSYTHLETPEGEIDVVEGSVEASAAGNTVGARGGVVSGPGGTTAFGEVTHDVDELGLVTSAAEVAGDTLGVGGPADLGLPDLRAAQSALGDAAGDAVGGALADSGLEGVAREAVVSVVDDASETVERTVEETAADSFENSLDDLS